MTQSFSGQEIPHLDTVIVQRAVYLPNALWEQFGEAARDIGLTRQQILRTMIEDFTRRYLNDEPNEHV